MPLEVEVLRDGEPRQLSWDYFTLSCMYTVAIKEGAPNHKGLLADDKTFGELKEGEWIDFSMVPIYYLDIPGCKLVEKGTQKVKRHHEFYDKDGNVVLEFEPGDVFRAWRSYKT